MFLPSVQPSSPRWFFFPGPLGRGFLCPLVSLLIVCGCLVGCASPQLNDYREKQPTFAPEAFFDGFLTAHGLVKDYSGEVIRTFNADINACWRGGLGTLDEQFVFDDGEQQSRLWTLKPSGEQRYTATAGDVVGQGQASWAGNAFFLNYTLRIDTGDGDTLDVDIDDRMYRISDTVVVNESRIFKWGLPVGQILLTIVRHPDQPATCPLD